MPHSTATLDDGLVTKAVTALQAFHTRVTAQQKRKLLDDDPLISLIIAVKTIPQKKLRPVQIHLPHTLYPCEEYTTCLITKDDKQIVKVLLENKAVHGITKVISLEKLRTDYKSFEAKRKLSASYDVFLCDRRIYALLPSLLGKKFFEKKKYPFAVDMKKSDLYGEISRSQHSTYLNIGRGSCMAVPIARVSFSVDAVVENITQAMERAICKLPQGWRNIQSIHIKTVDSIALPIFNSPPNLSKALPDLSVATRKVKRVKLETLEVAENEDACMRAASVDGDGGLIQSPSLQPPSPSLKRMKTPGNKYSAKKIKGSTITKSLRNKRKHVRKSL